MVVARVAGPANEVLILYDLVVMQSPEVLILALAIDGHVSRSDVHSNNQSAQKGTVRYDGMCPGHP